MVSRGVVGFTRYSGTDHSAHCYASEPLPSELTSNVIYKTVGWPNFIPKKRCPVSSKLLKTILTQICIF